MTRTLNNSIIDVMTGRDPDKDFRATTKTIVERIENYMLLSESNDPAINEDSLRGVDNLKQLPRALQMKVDSTVKDMMKVLGATALKNKTIYDIKHKVCMVTFGVPSSGVLLTSSDMLKFSKMGVSLDIGKTTIVAML